MEKDLNKAKEHFKKHYFNEDISNRIHERVHHGLHRKKMSFARKLAYSGSAAVAAVAMFIGLAYFSPTVASVAAKIPYLSMIFESKPVIEEMREVLTEKGYDKVGISMSYHPEKLVTVNINGAEEYVQSVTPEVKSIVEEILYSKNFNAYAIEVKREIEPTHELSEEEEKEWEKFDKMYATVGDVLKDYGLKPYSFGIDHIKMTYEFELPNTETRIDEIKQSVRSAMDAENLKEYKLKVRVYDVKKADREERWMPIINTIAEGIFGNEEYKVEGVGYTNKNDDYMYIKITSTASSTDEDFEEVRDKIESTILEFLESEKTKKIIKDDAYKIVIISKDKKEYEINSK